MRPAELAADARILWRMLCGQPRAGSHAERLQGFYAPQATRYDAFRARVRMLEAHFLVPIVAQNTRLLQGEWQKLVCEDLLLPSFKISRIEAVGRRLRRNYGFLFAIVLVAWITKIFLHAEPRIHSWASFYNALHVGTSIPSWFVAAVFAGTIISVVVLIIYVRNRSSGEIGEFGTHRSLWRI